MTEKIDRAATARANPPGRPWWLGIAVGVMGAIWLYAGLTLPQGAQYAMIGPGAFVSAIGAALAILGVVLLVQIGRGEIFAAQDAESDAPASWPALGLAVGAAALPLLTIKWLGFPLTAAGSFLIVTLAFGERRMAKSAAIAIALGVVSWLGFTGLGVDLGGFLPLLGI